MVLESIFGFLLNYAPALSVFIFAVIILVVINIFYKLLINQNEAKQLKQRTKDISKEMKEAQKSGDKEKSKQLMSQLLTENNKMMKMTMKPMIVSLIVVIILLPSLATFYGDKIVAIQDGKGSVTLNGAAYQIEKSSDSLIRVGGGDCQLPCTSELGGYNYKITPEGSSIKFAQVVAVLPVSLPLLGSSLGWLGWYIIISIPLAIIVRKAMKIYM